MGELGLHLAKRDAGENRDDQLLLIEVDVVDGAEVLGFDGEVDEVGVGDRFGEGIDDGEAEFVAQGLGAGGQRFADAEIGGFGEARGGEGAHEGCAHDAAADDCDCSEGHAAQPIRSPKIARPMRTIVAPSAMATA